MPRIAPLIVAGTLCCSALLAVPAQGAARNAATKSSHLQPQSPERDRSYEPDPNDVFDNAVREYSAGHMQKAESLFRQALDLDPDNADAHYNLGAICEWRKDYSAALTEYRAAERLRPNDPDIKQAIAQAAYKLKNRSVLDKADAKIKQDQELAMHGQLAKEDFASQNYVEAVGHLSRLAEAMPEDAKVQFALGQSLRALKYYDWAAYRLKLAIYLDPDNDMYRKTIADLDEELDTVQQQAYTDSAQMAISKIAPLTSSELAQSGLGKDAF